MPVVLLPWKGRDGTKPMLKATELMNMNKGLEENEAQGFMDLIKV